MISTTVTRMPRGGRVLSPAGKPVVEGVGSRWVSGLQARGRQGVGREGACEGVGVPVERGPVDPVDPVARLVVAGVERCFGLAAPRAGLFGRLAFLGSGEDAAHRDSGGEESGVVRAPVEVG